MKTFFFGWITGAILSAIITFSIMRLPPDLHWKYSRDQIHQILVWGEGNDTLQSAIEHWYITVEKPQNSRQEEIDSIESIITKYSKDLWE
jgi:hypothetical protein